MNTAIFCIYAAIAFAAILFSSLREFHMLQLNGYKTPEHSWWMKKNFNRYILPAKLFAVQFILLLFYSKTAMRIMIIVLAVFNIFIIIKNKPGKKFKKPLVYTARVKRMMTTFWILAALITGAGILISGGKPDSPWMYIYIGSVLYLTPILVPLSNICNKPIEKAVQKTMSKSLEQFAQIP